MFYYKDICIKGIIQIYEIKNNFKICTSALKILQI